MNTQTQQNNFTNNFEADYLNEVELQINNLETELPSNDSIWEEIGVSEDEWDYVLDSVASSLEDLHYAL